MQSRIIILGGETDTGKTLQSLIYGENDERIRVIDTENRVQQTIDFHKLDRNIEVINVLELYNKTDESKNIIKYQPDYYSSYLKLRQEIIKAVDNSSEYDILVMDGISPIRTVYCYAKWLHDHPDRQQPQPLEWAEINNSTRQLIEPLIHLCRMESKTVIFTVQMKDKYVKKVIVGRELDVNDWGDYNVDYIIELSRPIDDRGEIIDNEYTAHCTKSIIGSWTESMNNVRNLYDVFLELGI